MQWPCANKLFGEKKQFMKKNILKTVPLKDLPEREILHSFNAVNDASGLCSTKH